MAAVIELNPDQVPIARPRSSSPNVALMMARLPGTRKADENQRAQKQRVGFNHPLDVGDRRVKVGLEGGQRDVDDRGIDEGHARAEDRRSKGPSAR
jgi:hypothetical protein